MLPPMFFGATSHSGEKAHLLLSEPEHLVQKVLRILI